MKDIILLVGFGGPRSSKEVRPFLKRIFDHASIPAARFEMIAGRYEKIGGSSPYVSIVLKQQKALKKLFKKRNLKIPVEVGFTYSKPLIEDTLKKIKNKKIKRIFVFVLSPFRSGPSFGRYQRRVDEALKKMKIRAKAIYAPPFYSNKEFIEAFSDKIVDAPQTQFIFSAHSIPIRLAKESGYAEEFSKASGLVARRLGLKNWKLAYQSRSGNPNNPWLGPDLKEVIEGLDVQKIKNVCVAPIGFLIENMELLYDLDIEAKKICVQRGLKFSRTDVINDHPKFIKMMTNVILQRTI